MENQVQTFKPQTVRAEIIGQMESMLASKLISLPENFKESVFFAMEKLTSMQDIEKVPAISITRALLKMFSNKLDFNKNHCYFFIQNDKTSPTGKSLRFGWQYQGLIAVAKGACNVSEVYPVLINENDTFDMFYKNGVLVVENHKPTFNGSITGGYCVIQFKDERINSRYYTMEELNKRRDKSMAKNGNFWAWEREMYEKTLVNATLKRTIETHSETNSDDLYNEPDTIDVSHREVIEEQILIQNDPSVIEPEKVEI